MEINEALSAMRELVNSYKAVKKLEEVLDYAAICKQAEVEVTVRIEKLRKEADEFKDLKGQAETLRREIRNLGRERDTLQMTLDSFKQSREELLKKIGEI